ncbi:ryanodine receptor 1-like [Sphaerodactylus townsendi]|uniref:ryanodine receptor 1-like n=1 Tax=Sphaerodactylus townsendi TaxID=933632 RepID=UPI0020275A33|nr:ryanodine receptor 1-like [Sphaerodactylus townsendi]
MVICHSGDRDKLPKGTPAFRDHHRKSLTRAHPDRGEQLTPMAAPTVSRIDGTVDNPPCLKLTHRTFGSQNAIIELLFLRLSMPVEFHEKFKITAGTTPLTRALTIPEDDVKEVDLDSEFEQLKKTASRKEAEEAEKEKQGPPPPGTPKEPPKEAPKIENEKDASTEKSKTKRGFLFKAKKATTFITPAPVVPTVPRLEEEVVPDDRDDPEIIMNTTTYYYSVRIFAGQEPTCVWVGWVTPDYHQHDMNFDLTKVRNVTVTMGDDKGNIHDSIKRSNCYMVWGGDFVSNTQQTRVSTVDLVIGCLVDLATGLMTFTANGKEVNTFFQVEPNTKLFPAVFTLPTSQNVIQFELGKLKNIMPISAAMFRSERKNPEPQSPPRLNIQMLTPMTWSRMPSDFLCLDVGRVSDRHGWMVECTEPNIMMALHIPEESRCIDILELSERLDLLKFHSHTLKLYCAVCALGNNRVAHALCSHVDESQLLYTIDSNHLPGLLRSGYYDLLISMHLESAKRGRLMMNNEYIVPMTEETKSITLFPHGSKKPGLPGVGMSACLRPPLHFSDICFISTNSELYQQSPFIPLEILKVKAVTMLTEAVQDGGQHTRDPVGGSVEFQFVPVLKLICTLLIMAVFEDEDVRHILKMIEPNVFSESKEEEAAEAGEEGGEEGEGEVPEEEEEEEEEEALEEEEEEGAEKEAGGGQKEEAEEGDKRELKAIEAGEVEAKEDEEGLEEGLLQMTLPESVKLQMCNLLQFFCDRELQHRVEAIIAFSELYMENLQTNQRQRYNTLMLAFTMSAAETARRTREFRSPPQEQINMLLHFKNGADEEECPVPEEIRDELLEFHADLLSHCGIQAEGEEEEQTEDQSFHRRLMSLVDKVMSFRKKEEPEEEQTPEEEPMPTTLQELISHTMVHWAQESFIQSPELVRVMFSLLHRQYDGLGELIRALPKAYTINANSVEDTMNLLESLGQIRSLLIVQMGPEEENLMILSIGWVLPSH